MVRNVRIQVFFSFLATLVVAGVLVLAGCEDSSLPVAPDATPDAESTEALSKHKEGHNPGGGGGNNQDPTITTITLSGGMVATDQQVVISKDNKRELFLTTEGGTFVSELNFVNTYEATWNADGCSTSDNFDALGLISRDDLFALILDTSGNDGNGLRGQTTPGLHMRVRWLDPALGNFVTDWKWQERDANVKLFVKDSNVNPSTRPSPRIPGSYTHATGGTLEIRYHPSPSASSNTVGISCPNLDPITATLQQQ